MDSPMVSAILRLFQAAYLPDDDGYLCGIYERGAQENSALEFINLPVSN